MRAEFRSDSRGYILVLDRDLLGAFVLTRHWFGLNNRRHGSRVDVYRAEEEAAKAVRRIFARRFRHGYRLLGST